MNAVRYPVVELRQYTLHPGQRDVLINLFDREFVETQEAVGMAILGQFRDLDNPDRFVWLRGFGDMPRRGGETWAPNWVMDFHRADLPPTPTARDAFDSDFAVLQGDWRVRHRFLRIQADRREWLDADGTVRHRMLMDGRANVEEHLINAPGGPYHAVALRSYDPKSSEWSVWWLDSRSPDDDLDPPARGRFTDGTATFYGDTTVDERPARLRFVWADITATAARWEQSLSRDAGASWERNWIMDYQRAD